MLRIVIDIPDKAYDLILYEQAIVDSSKTWVLPKPNYTRKNEADNETNN